MVKIEDERALEALRPFNSGNFYAIASGLDGDLGWLKNHPAWEKRYRDTINDPGKKIVYTVMHYQTPIAWIVKDSDGLPVEVVIPKIFHSRPTTRPQAACRRSLPYSNKHVMEL